MTKKQNLNPVLRDGERMMKRRRGRPRKSTGVDPERVRSIQKLIRYTPLEWKKVEEAMESKKVRSFSRHARESTMGHKTYNIDADVAKELRAGRKDIQNFANAISARQLSKQERKELLLSIPTLKVWWPCIEKVLSAIQNFFDGLHENASVSLITNKEATT